MTMTTVEKHTGVPWDGRTPFERWVADDLKLPRHTGYAAGPLGTLEVAWWEQRGFSAGFVDVIGAESLGGMFVGELAPRSSSKKTRQLYEEIIYVLSGIGTATVTTPEGSVSFEWGPRSLFAIPLNCTYQLHNTSGQQPARFVSVNTLPITYSLYRDEDFIYNTDRDFGRLKLPSSAADAVLYEPDASFERTAVNLYDTLFVPDALAVERTRFLARGEATNSVYFEMANSPISSHAMDLAGGTFFNPHRHGPSAFVFTVKGAGYTLMWPDGGEVQRWDWPKDDVGVVVPPNGWWHGHFVTSDEGCQVAIKLMSRKFPLSHTFDRVHKHISEGGTVLRYNDLEEGLRTRIWDMFVEECAKNGLEAKLPSQAARALQPA